MFAHAARTYALSKGELPERPEDLKSFLFFQPTFELSSFICDGDALRLGTVLPFPRGPEPIELTVYRPGSRAWEEDRRKRQEGGYTNYYLDTLQAHARNEREFLQLYWSWQLADFLHAAIESYKNALGSYPASVEELLSFLPPINEEAWVAPMTGKPVRLSSDKTDESSVVYFALPNGSGFGLLVPLFGAGSDEPLYEKNRRFHPAEGYHAGRYFRKAHGTGEDTPLIYGF